MVRTGTMTTVKNKKLRNSSTFRRDVSVLVMIMPKLKHTQLKPRFQDAVVGLIVGAGEKSVKRFIVLISQDRETDYFDLFISTTIRPTVSFDYLDKEY
jgi:hypothetical protein